MLVKRLRVWVQNEANRPREYEDVKIAYFCEERWPYLEITLPDDGDGVVVTIVIPLSMVEEMVYIRA